ncbi:MAG TPA: VapE domain-containing protein [Paludibacter sp.]
MNKLVTLFRNFKIVAGHKTIEEIMNMIRNGDIAAAIQELRQLLADGNITAYNNAKKALLAFTPSAMFVGGRKMEYMVRYSYVIVLDLDKLTVEMMITMKGIICGCKFTLACFVSPSGNGLKVLVRVDTEPVEHLKTFLKVQQYYSLITGAVIDPSGKDITRLCFLSWDPEAYFNPLATVFGAGIVENGHPQGVTIHLEPTNPQQVDQKDQAKIFKRCVKFVNKYVQFVEGQRNSFVFKLALQLRKEGVDEGAAFLLIQKDYNYDDREVRSTVRSAFQTNTIETSTIASVKVGLKPEKKDIKSSKKKKKKIKNSILEQIRFPSLSQMDELFDKAFPHTEDEDPKSDKAKKKKPTHYDLKEVETMIKALFELRYNLVKGTVEWRLQGTEHKFQNLEDFGMNSIWRWLNNHDQFISVKILIPLLSSNFSPDFDVFIEYFKGIHWDGKTDYIGRLCKTVWTTDDDYWEFCFRKWFVAYAMSLYVDEVINHTVIVFVGKQGVGKSSWMKNLVPDALKEYLAPGAVLTDNKDIQIMVGECALIILDEFEALNRHDLAIFKELITRASIRIRRPYGRSSVVLPHRASFIAAVNDKQILNDPTGSRRYLCASVIKVEYEKKMNIDKCMAQAIALGTKGFQYWFKEDEIRELTIHNQIYSSKPIEEELIETWLRTVTMEEWNQKDQFQSGRNIKLMKAADVTLFLLTKFKFPLQPYTNSQIGKFMAKYNFIEFNKHDGKYYLVRIVTEDSVERSSRTLKDDEPDQGMGGNNNWSQQPDPYLPAKDADDELPF